MYCTNCGKDGVRENSTACLGCGISPHAAEKNYCCNCGEKLNNVNQVICTKCGCSVKSIATSGESKRIIAGILGLCFGGIGVHKFYLGSWGWGIVYLAAVVLTAGFGALVTSPIALVESIIYLTMDDTKFAKKYSQETRSPFRW
ncbi:MAG: TM2 domain-containing protein [Planctomycetaceae bacterium]|jgi:TM2 domain-containing membrane protein YozV|nr:TM2 domain-containing protein [Planctomycetaceae bacterium]